MNWVITIQYNGRKFWTGGHPSIPSVPALHLSSNIHKDYINLTNTSHLEIIHNQQNLFVYCLGGWNILSGVKISLRYIDPGVNKLGVGN